MEKRYEFNEVAFISALAVGVPGKRTFFLAVGQKGEWVRVWLEKEELEALALAIHQFLFQLSRNNSRSSRHVEAAPLSDDIPAGLPAAELEIDEIALSYDEEKATLDVSVHVLGPQRMDSAVLHCRATLAQLRQLGDQADNVCAAGRPRCPLCGGPIEPTGHICPRRN